MPLTNNFWSPIHVKGNVNFWAKKFVNLNAQLYGNSVSWRQREPSDFLVMINLLLWNSFDSFYGWLVLYDFVKLHKIEGPSHLWKWSWIWIHHDPLIDRGFILKTHRRKNNNCGCNCHCLRWSWIVPLNDTDSIDQAFTLLWGNHWDWDCLRKVSGHFFLLIFSLNIS